MLTSSAVFHMPVEVPTIQDPGPQMKCMYCMYEGIIVTLHFNIDNNIFQLKQLFVTESQAATRRQNGKTASRNEKLKSTWQTFPWGQCDTADANQKSRWFMDPR